MIVYEPCFPAILFIIKKGQYFSQKKGEKENVDMIFLDESYEITAHGVELY